jgi:hypothetical protein
VQSEIRKVDRTNDPDGLMRMGGLMQEARSAAAQEAKAKLDTGEMPVFHSENTTSVITPSAKEPGRYQVTTYTDQGAMGDSQFDTLEEAIESVGVKNQRLLSKAQARKAMADRLEQENTYQSKKARVESGPRVDDTVYVTESDGTVGEYTYRGKDGEGNAMVVKGLTQKSVPMANVQMEKPNVQQQPQVQTEAPAQGQPAQAEGVGQQKTPKQPEAEGGRVAPSVSPAAAEATTTQETTDTPINSPSKKDQRKLKSLKLERASAKGTVEITAADLLTLADEKLDKVADMLRKCGG